MKILRLSVVSVALIICSTASLSAQGKKGGGGGSGAASSQPAAASSSSQASSTTATIEAQMLTYGGLDLMSPSIANNVCANVNDLATIVIFDQTTFANLQAYAAFYTSSKLLVSQYEAIDSDPKDFRSKLQALAEQHNQAAQTAAQQSKTPLAQKRAGYMSEMLKAKTFDLGLSSTVDPFGDAAQMASAIAASNTESGGTIVMPDSAVAVVLSRDLRHTESCAAKKITVIYPPLFGKGSVSDTSSIDIGSVMQVVEDARNVTEQYVIAQNEAYIKNHAPGTGQSNPAVSGGNPTLATMLSDANGLYDTLANSLTQINSATGVLGMASVVQGYELATLLAGQKNSDNSGWQTPPAYILLASVLGAGGTEHTHKNVWTILWKGDDITYSGGLVVNTALWRVDSNGPIVSKIYRYRMPYSHVQSPSNTTGVTNGDNLTNP